MRAFAVRAIRRASATDGRRGGAAGARGGALP